MAKLVEETLAKRLELDLLKKREEDCLKMVDHMQTISDMNLQIVELKLQVKTWVDKNVDEHNTMLAMATLKNKHRVQVESMKRELKQARDELYEVIGEHGLEMKKKNDELKQTKDELKQTKDELKQTKDDLNELNGLNVDSDAVTCAISLDIVHDPVTTSDGHTYERNSIESWFARHDTPKPPSPKTGLPLADRSLSPDERCKAMIARYHEMACQKVV